jgi:hypothetical protein
MVHRHNQHFLNYLAYSNDKTKQALSIQNSAQSAKPELTTTVGPGLGGCQQGNVGLPTFRFHESTASHAIYCLNFNDIGVLTSFTLTRIFRSVVSFGNK